MYICVTMARERKHEARPPPRLLFCGPRLFVFSRGAKSALLYRGKVQFRVLSLRVLGFSLSHPSFSLFPFFFLFFLFRKRDGETYVWKRWRLQRKGYVGVYGGKRRKICRAKTRRRSARRGVHIVRDKKTLTQMCGARHR